MLLKRNIFSEHPLPPRVARALSAAERWTFATALALFVLGLVLVPFLAPLNNLFDFCLLLAATLLLWLLARSRALPFAGYAALLALFALHGLGALGMFDRAVLGLGYDKWMHLAAGVAFAVFFWGWLPVRKTWHRVLLTLLCVMGLAAINEIAEFVGSYWLGFKAGGITAMGTGQPVTGSPLQVYDTHFDMLFNLAGTAVGIVASWLAGKLSRR